MDLNDDLLKKNSLPSQEEWNMKNSQYNNNHYMQLCIIVLNGQYK